jgi:hypothetical protein
LIVCCRSCGNRRRQFTLRFLIHCGIAFLTLQIRLQLGSIG